MGETLDSRLALLRFSGDISTKSRVTRFQFVRRLLHNLKDALSSEGIPPRIQVSHDRIFVELPQRQREHGLEALKRVFGLQSILPVERRPASKLQELVAAGGELFRDRVRGRRFAVRARRVGDRSRIAVGSRELERALGAALLPASAGVDLGQPEMTVHVELFGTDAYFFPTVIPACGGLPLGVEGHAVALVSGGFDSAVAAWSLLKRGVSIDYVFCNLGGVTHQQGVLRVAKVLADRWSYGDRPQLHAVDFAPLVAELQGRTRKRYWQILLKRLMLRTAETIARQQRAAAIVTGEAVGQVSSQTLQNLAVISQATPLLLLRPLAGLNKDEIISMAERIGTFELSKVVGEYCAMVPRRPATGATLDAVLAEEERIDGSLVAHAAAGRSVFDLRSVDVEKLGLPELEVESIPDGATVIDLRSEAEFRAWHHPDAVRLDFPHAVQIYPTFDRAKTYVLYCELGLKSAHLAEFMRREGFDAYHFKGGERALRAGGPDAPPA